MTYDELNRVVTAKDIWGQTLTFTYDDSDNRTVVEDSQGSTTTSTYDDANNLTDRGIIDATAEVTVEFDYNGRNQLEQIRRYSGPSPALLLATTDYSYENAGRLENLHHTNGTPSNIANYTFTYDDGGRLTNEERQRHSVDVQLRQLQPTDR